MLTFQFSFSSCSFKGFKLGPRRENRFVYSTRAARAAREAEQATERELNREIDQNPRSPVSKFNLEGSSTPPTQRTSLRAIVTPLVITSSITQPIVQPIAQPIVPTIVQFGNQNQNIPMAATSAWLVGRPINIAGQAHQFPKNLDRYLPKFIHDGPVTAKEHIHMYKDGLG